MIFTKAHARVRATIRESQILNLSFPTGFCLLLNVLSQVQAPLAFDQDDKRYRLTKFQTFEIHKICLIVGLYFPHPHNHDRIFLKILKP